MDQGYNYGVLCGYNGLIVLDVDSKQGYEFLKDKLPPTFTVKTGSNQPFKKHYYYFSKESTDSHTVKDTAGQILVEIRGGDHQKGQGIIAPGSIHP